MSLQALHFPEMTIAMPIPELASEKAPMSRGVMGAGIGLPIEGRRRIDSHHSRSAVVPLGAECGMKGQLRPVPNIDSRVVR